jgi:hypothetical protein
MPPDFDQQTEDSSCSRKFVPRLLTYAQKDNRVTVSQELFDYSNADENFLKNVIKGNEAWVYGYDV